MDRVTEQVALALRRAMTGRLDEGCDDACLEALGSRLATAGVGFDHVVASYRKLLGERVQGADRSVDHVEVGARAIEALARGYSRGTRVARAVSSPEQQRMESLGRLTGGVAHDINNLLTVILCFTRFVKEDVAAEHPAQSDLAEVLHAAQTAAGLVGQVLQLVREQSPSTSTVDVSGAVHDVCRMLRCLLGPGITTAIIAPEQRVRVEVDPAQLTQLVMNLLLNARDAMPGGGTVTLRIDTIQAPDCEGVRRRHARFQVEDTGLGIAPELLERIFDPFFSTKRELGTGLGLATCRDIVTRAGGQITATSEAGAGSVLTVLLPEVGAGERSSAGCAA